MNNSINLTSQKMSFVNKISILQKALSNDETPTPSYLYKEINDISYESVGCCESLVEFLVDRLRHQSCHVKLKVLKVMKHVLKNGTKEFQLGLKQQVSLIKECTKFSGPPHPVHGNTPYVLVRNIAVELCEMLYDIDPLSLKSTSRSAEDAQPPQPKYGGMGPSRSGGAIQGFGNSPMSQSKGFAGTILHEIEKLGTKLSETPADRQNAVLARLNLSGSSSNYQPPVVSPDSSSIFSRHESRETSPCQDHNINKLVPRHFPGKAGGGWNDDDEDGTGDTGDGALGNDEDRQTSLQDIQESRESTERQESLDKNSDEELLVDSMVTPDPTLSDEKVGYLPNSKIFQFLRQCCKLRCAVIIDRICQNFAEQDLFVVTRSLQLLESIVLSQQELINMDVLVKQCKAALVNCFVAAGEKAADTSTSSSNCVDRGSCEHWKSIHMKAAKLILILHQLSSDKDIFPRSEIVNELSRSASLPHVPVT